MHKILRQKSFSLLAILSVIVSIGFADGLADKAKMPEAPTSSAALIQWTANLISPLLSFSYLDNPKTYWQPYQKFFSKQGWENFQSAIIKSKNIETIQSLDIASKVVLGHQGEASADEANHLWHISLPLTVVYASNQIAASYPMLVKVTIKSELDGEHLPRILNIQASLSGKPKSKAIKPRGCSIRRLP